MARGLRCSKRPTQQLAGHARPRTDWSQSDDDWGTLTPGPRMSPSVVQRGTQDAAALPMSVRYKIQRINPVDSPSRPLDGNPPTTLTVAPQ